MKMDYVGYSPSSLPSAEMDITASLLSKGNRPVQIRPIIIHKHSVDQSVDDFPHFCTYVLISNDFYRIE